MKDTKRRIEHFPIYNRTTISRHLEKMAQKGWMIEKIGGFGWVYRRIEPKSLRFSVTYYGRASEFDPEPTEEQKIFEEFCAHAGWVLACSFGQMQIFYNEQENPVPIETEPSLEVEAIHTCAKKNLIPTQLIYLAIGLMQIGIFFVSLRQDPIELLSSTMRMFSPLCFLLLGVEAVAELVCYFGWYRRARKEAQYGTLLEPKGAKKLQSIITCIILLGLAVMLIDLFVGSDRQLKFITVLTLLYIPLLYIIVVQIKNVLKQQKASRTVNRTVTIVSSFVASFLLLGLILFATLSSYEHGFLADKGEETYEYQGRVWTVGHDELPLKIEDLVKTEYQDYSCTLDEEESFLLKRQNARQSPRFDAADFKNIPHLEYTVVEIKAPFLYKMCKDSLLKVDPIFDENYQLQDVSFAGTEEVYRLYDEKYGYRNDYVLCWDDVLVKIYFDWEVTAEQLKIVGERLGKRSA